MNLLLLQTIEREFLHEILGPFFGNAYEVRQMILLSVHTSVCTLYES